ncbi:hypothetical protein AX15_005323 [Amanita polypyramis BW_CC]|nr:hypothetical protein AX15_005323 [Amanita polypyramis BW_CC]
MSARYAPIAHDAELDDAFGSDNDDDEELPGTATHLVHPPPSAAGAYDFEREYNYDYPPPGSPPRPSSVARPNDYGNTNGRIPTSPAHRFPLQPSFFRRTVGALLPQHYSRVATPDSIPSRPIGGGTENDGVFANVMAKPQAPRTVRTENGEVYLMPEEVQRELLPSYSEAQADAVPPYWETVVHAPADSESGIVVDDLPTGSVFIFILNALISYFFQFLGFFLTYILHTTHAAKFGSRAGLGLTLIQYGFYSRTTVPDDRAQPDDGGTPLILGSYNGTDPNAPTPLAPVPDDNIGFSSKDMLSILFMSVGWFLLISSLVGYWRVKRWETSVRSSQTQQLPTPDQVERDRAVRRQLRNALGIPTLSQPAEGHESHMRLDEHGNILIIPGRGALAEARLTRDLRAAGLL